MSRSRRIANLHLAAKIRDPFISVMNSLVLSQLFYPSTIANIATAFLLWFECVNVFEALALSLERTYWFNRNK